MFKINMKRKALRKITELDEKRKKRIKEIILILKPDPVPFRKMDIRKLKGYDNPTELGLESRGLFMKFYGRRRQ